MDSIERDKKEYRSGKKKKDSEDLTMKKEILT